MKPLVLVFWNICLLRRGPEQVPTAAWFVATVALADLLMSLLLSLRMDSDFQVLPALTYLLVNMSVIASVTWFALGIKKFEKRFLATVTALFGCDLLMSLVLVIFSGFSGALDQPLTLGAVALTGIWSLAVTGFILHKAMEFSMTAGVLMALAIALFSVTLGQAATVIPMT
jgi:hypothetical protein